MKPNPFDREFFSVLCRHKGELYFAELCPATKTLAAVVDDIATGQIEHVLSVFKWNAIEHSAEDISHDVASIILIGCLLENNGFIASDHVAMPFMEEHLGCSTVRL